MFHYSFRNIKQRQTQIRISKDYTFYQAQSFLKVLDNHERCY